MNPNPPTPLFILCTERSGSTLLRYILDTHPAVCCPGELFLGQLVLAMRTTLSRTTGLLQKCEPQEQDRFLRAETHRLILGPVEEYARRKGKTFWCDKTPANLEYLDEIEWAFPEARYICLHRACLDVVHSCLELRQRLKPVDRFTPFEEKHPEIVLSFLLERWVQAGERLLEFEAAHPDQCHRIRYEDLLTDPARVLDPLFRFIGVTWDPSLLDKVFSTPHDTGTGDDKILSTDRILRENVGKGASIAPALLAKLAPALLERRHRVELSLGYRKS